MSEFRYISRKEKRAMTMEELAAYLLIFKLLPQAILKLK